MQGRAVAASATASATATAPSTTASTTTASSTATAPSTTASTTTASSNAPTTNTFLSGYYTHSKAGVGGDRAAIDRIIANASKGSAYEANALAREAKLTARVAALKAEVAGTPPALLAAYTRDMAQYAASFAAQRSWDPVFVCLDYDAFFAAVAARDDPSLAGVPFVVGGLSMVSTASYAARAYGIRSAMPGFVAKLLCPQLVFVDVNFAAYSEASSAGMVVLKRYDPDLSSHSLDEAVLHLSPYLSSLPPTDPPLPLASLIEGVVAGMRREVTAATRGLTISAGVGVTPMLAKIASDVRKPDGQFVVPADPAGVAAFLAPLPLRKLPGVGRVTEALLAGLGFHTVGDILASPERCGYLRAALGERTAQWLVRCALGGDVDDDTGGEDEGGVGRKGVSQERTFGAADAGLAGVTSTVTEAANSVASTLVEEGLLAATVCLKMKSVGYVVTQKQCALPRPTADPAVIAAAALTLLRGVWPIDLRLIGVRVSQLQKAVVEGPLDSFVSRSSAPPPAPPTVIDMLDDDSEVEEVAPPAPREREGACFVCGLTMVKGREQAHVEACLVLRGKGRGPHLRTLA